MSQIDIVVDTEADNWWKRNKSKLPPADDPVLSTLSRNGIGVNNVLEIGCANGWRLDALRTKYAATCTGYDISFAALTEGRHEFPKIRFYYGEASRLRYSEDDEFDVLIYGFMMYLADRASLFRIVAEGDRVLKDGGHLVIQDFTSGNPVAVRYRHDDRLLTYKMAYAGLWTANPTYRCIDSRFDVKEGTGVWLLKKDIAAPWKNPEESP